VPGIKKGAIYRTRIKILILKQKKSGPFPSSKIDVSPLQRKSSLSLGNRHKKFGQE
jgi:hypothetical protein